MVRPGIIGLQRGHVMEPKALAVIFIAGLVFVGIFVGGFFMPGIWRPIMITAGAVGCIAWLGGALWLASALNSDR